METFQTDLANKKSDKINIGGIRLWLAKLQELDKKIGKIRTKSLNRYKEIDKVLHY